MRIKLYIGDAPPDADGTIRRRYRALKPRKVHQRGKVIEALPVEVVATPADDSDPRPKGTKVTGSRYIGLVDCPDCSAGLASRGTSGMVCPTIWPALAEATPAPCHPTCIVACGWDGVTSVEDGTDG